MYITSLVLFLGVAAVDAEVSAPDIDPGEEGPGLARDLHLSPDHLHCRDGLPEPRGAALIFYIKILQK